MDCRMPVMDGYEATKAIREQETEKIIPIIALTAISSFEDKQRCIASGMNDVITKPFKKEYLVNILNQWLNSSNQNIDESKQFFAAEMMIPKHESISQRSSLDLTRLEKFRDEMGDEYSEILKAILQGYEDFFPQFEGHVPLETNEELARAAHNLKSRAAHLGATNLSEIASEIELLADNKKLKQASIKIQELKQEYDCVLAELDKVGI